MFTKFRTLTLFQTSAHVYYIIKLIVQMQYVRYLPLIRSVCTVRREDKDGGNTPKTVYWPRWTTIVFWKNRLLTAVRCVYAFRRVDPVVTRRAQLEQHNTTAGSDANGDRRRWRRRCTFKGADGARGTEATAAAVAGRERPPPRASRARATPCRGGRRRHPSAPAARHWCGARPINILPPRLLPKILGR